jgi:hypothetical protein
LGKLAPAIRSFFVSNVRCGTRIAPELRPSFADYLATRRDDLMHERPHINRFGFALLSLAVAFICVTVLIMQVRDRWHSPAVKTAAEARQTTTGQAARAAGARISQSEPKPAVEPDPAGPKPAQPAHPN